MAEMTETINKTMRLELIEMVGDDKILLAVIESICTYTAQLDSLHRTPSRKIYKRTKGKEYSPYKTKGWSEERRRQQRQRLLESRPWEKSTGPRTHGGKEKSKMNGLKNGGRSTAAKDVFAALRAQRRFVRALNAELKPHIRKISGYSSKRDFMV